MRPEKQAIVEQYKSWLDESDYALLADYMGMDVVQLATLRDQLMDKGAHFHVIKNSLFKYATTAGDAEVLMDGLTGPSALITGGADVVEVAKILKDFTKKNALPVIKVGALSGRALSKEDVDQLASMPPRPEMLAKMVGTVAAPLTGMVGVLNQKVLSLLYVLQAAQQKKEND